MIRARPPARQPAIGPLNKTLQMNKAVKKAVFFAPR
jgi:hypothetical protein